MKAFIVILSLFIMTSCATITPREYYSLNEIKSIYGLSNKECRNIVSLAKKGEIGLIYHAGRDEWMYPANVKYSQFKKH